VVWKRARDKGGLGKFIKRKDRKGERENEVNGGYRMNNRRWCEKEPAIKVDRENLLNAKTAKNAKGEAKGYAHFKKAGV